MLKILSLKTFILRKILINIASVQIKEKYELLKYEI